MGAVGYWLLVVGLVSLGVASILSIGAPFVLLGLTLAALRRFRGKPEIFWPSVLAPVGFTAGWILAVPVSCRTTYVKGPGVKESVENCRAILPFESNSSDLALWPAIVLGLVGAALFALLARRLLRTTTPSANS